ncbi:Multidrug resistance protein MdtL [Ewingella americana]|uniref:Bcr/CflA family efflux transporter n=3 Tax=Ewingella americana TaxID=41202 RepID=A0A085GBP3_EWIA3|nr:putative multidrug resistance protein [Ewingella americana ATCC 33852]STQ44548.1 Multidrug resistance protein MdtL [Ewingella americana]
MFYMQKFLFLLLTLVLLGPLGIDLYLPAIPAIAKGLNSAEAIIQSSISLFILVMGLGQLIAGPLVDRYGRRPIAIIGVIVYLAGAIVAATAETAFMFMFSRVIQGLAVCCTSVVVFSSVRDRMSGDDAARAYGFLNGTLNIIPALAPLIGGLIAQFFGWRAPFWALCGYSLLILALVLFKLPETRPADTQSGGLPFKQYARILFNKRFITFAAVNAGAMGMALTYVSLAPTVLMSQAGLTPFEFSLVFGANGFWIMAVSFIANRIIQKVGRPACLASGALLMFLGCAGLVAGLTLIAPEQQHATWLYMLPVASACAGLAFLIGPATSYALEPFSNEAGVASALVGSVQMAGGALFGFIAMALPLQPKLSLALVMLAGGCLALLARRASKKSAGRLTRLG